MFDPKSIDNIANRLADVVPSSFNHLKQDMEKNFHAILQSALAKLDLVTREEFEVQKAVLAKTRSKLEDLEATVAEIEQQNQHSQNASKNKSESTGKSKNKSKSKNESQNK